MLTPQQQEAVDAPADKHIVLEAAAGGGKTTVIGERINTLIQRDGVDPSHMIVATFSKSQAEDMALRIFSKFPYLKDTALGTGFNGSGQILTLHALARRMVVNYYEDCAHLNVAPSFKERKIIEDAVDALNWTIGKGEDAEPVGWESILHWINKFKGAANGDDLIPYTQSTIYEWAKHERIGEYAEKFARVATSYQRSLENAGMWTFADMLRMCELKLTEDEEFRETYRKQFTHILVDEGQDTNIQCMRILGKLSPQSLFIVGDGDQELYGFLGARPEVNLRSGFDKRYGENGMRLWMTQNFRSTPVILDRANKLIHHNYPDRTSPYMKTLVPGLKREGADLTFEWYANPIEEAKAVITQIHQRMEEGELVPGQVMIMGRLNAQNAPIELELLRRGIPFVNLGNVSFFDQGIARVVISYMKLALNPSDWDAFQVVYNIASRRMHNKNNEYSPTRWLGKEFLDKVRGQGNLIEASVKNKYTKNARGWAQWTNGITDLETTMWILRDFNRADSAHSFMRKLKEEVLDAWIDDQYGVESDASGSVRDDLAVLMEIANQFHVGEFLDYAEQLRNLKGVKPEDLVDYVLVGTVYRFKGLERDVVYVIGMSDGLLPHAFAIGTASPHTDGLPVENTTSVRSERNVAFVAVTRAKIECHCSGVEIWPTHDTPMEPSRFLYEMGLLEQATEPV